jgi:hypothetical protein
MCRVDIPSKPSSQAESAILRFLAKLELDGWGLATATIYAGISRVSSELFYE